VVRRMEGGGGAPPLPPLMGGRVVPEAEEVGGTGGSFLGEDAEGGLIDEGNSNRRPTAAGVGEKIFPTEGVGGGRLGFGFILFVVLVVDSKAGILVPVPVEGIDIGGGPTPPSASTAFFFPS